MTEQRENGEFRTADWDTYLMNTREPVRGA
jgi:hypothetical protein